MQNVTQVMKGSAIKLLVAWGGLKAGATGTAIEPCGCDKTGWKVNFSSKITTLKNSAFGTVWKLEENPPCEDIPP